MILGRGRDQLVANGLVKEVRLALWLRKSVRYKVSQCVLHALPPTDGPTIHSHQALENPLNHTSPSLVLRRMLLRDVVLADLANLLLAGLLLFHEPAFRMFGRGGVG